MNTLRSLLGWWLILIHATLISHLDAQPPMTDESTPDIESTIVLNLDLMQGTFVLGEPIEWSLVAENQGERALKLGSWDLTPTCEAFLWSSGIRSSLTNHDTSEELDFRPRLPEPDYLVPGAWLEPGARIRLTCDLTEVYRLDKPGRFRLDVEISGLLVAVAVDERPRLKGATVARTLPQSASSKFEIRQLATEDLVAWRRQAGDGDMIAIRVVGVHRDVDSVVDLERATMIGGPEVRYAGALALARLPTIDATDVLGRAMLRESDPELKERMARLMVEERADLGAEPWIRSLASDTEVFHDFVRDGRTYRSYRLRSLARRFFADRSKPLDGVQVEELISQ